MDWPRLIIALTFCLALALLAIAITARRKGGLRRVNSSRRLRLRESLVLDARTALHWVEADTASFLIVSSSGTATVHPLSAANEARSPP